MCRLKTKRLKFVIGEGPTAKWPLKMADFRLQKRFTDFNHIWYDGVDQYKPTKFDNREKL